MPRGAEKIPLLIVPGGVREDAGIAGVPDGSLLSSLNWLTREGRAHPRPGYDQLGATLAAGDRVLGFGFHGSPFLETNLVVHTQTAAYDWDGSTFNAITGTWAAADPHEHIRFATFNQAGTTYLIRVNEDNAPDEWNGTGSFIDVTGSPPAGRDIAVTNGRLLIFAAGGDGKAIRWSGFNDRTAWNPNDLARLTDTPGDIIGGRAFGPLSVGIYLEDAFYLGIAQVGGTGRQFQFQFVSEIVGPLSTACILAFRGLHYWLAQDGAIYQVSAGGKPEEIGHSLGTTMETTLDWGNKNQAHGMVLPLHEPELWFFYPDSGDGTVKRAVSFNLTTGAMNPHLFGHEITASSNWTAVPEHTIDDLTGTIDGLSAMWSTIDAMGGEAMRVSLLGTSLGKVHRFNVGSQDDNVAIPWEFTHGWKPMSGMGYRFYADGVVSYWRRLGTPLTVTIGVAVTDSLGDTESEVTSTFDMAVDSQHLTPLNDLRGQWARVRHAGNSSLAGIQHRGAAFLGWKRGMT